MVKPLDNPNRGSAFSALIHCSGNGEVPEELVIQAAEESSDATLAHLIKHKDKAWARNGILKAMEINPLAALMFYGDYSDQLFYTKKLAETTKKLAEENPKAVLNFLHHAEKEHWAAGIRKIAEKVLSS